MYIYIYSYINPLVIYINPQVLTHIHMYINIRILIITPPENQKIEIHFL